MRIFDVAHFYTGCPSSLPNPPRDVYLLWVLDKCVNLCTTVPLSIRNYQKFADETSKTVLTIQFYCSQIPGFAQSGIFHRTQDRTERNVTYFYFIS